MLDIDRNPSPRTLLIFAATLPLALAVVGTVSWHAGSHRAAALLWLAAGLVAVIAFGLPRSRRWMYLGWSYLTYPIGWAASLIALGIVYLLVATPIALAFRALGHDPLQRRFDKSAPTYWVARPPIRDVLRYFRQF